MKFKKPLGRSSAVRMLQCRSVLPTKEGDSAGTTVGDQLVKDGVACSVGSAIGESVEFVRLGGGKSIALTVEETTELVDAHLGE